MTATHDSKGSIVSHQHPIRARALFGSPAPSCTGGAHRRCLLSAEQCCCPCHLDAPKPYIAPARVDAVFTCAVCFEPFLSRRGRTRHMHDEHPISTRQEVNA